jgi:hypothetical protein
LEEKNSSVKALEEKIKTIKNRILNKDYPSLKEKDKKSEKLFSISDNKQITT